MATITQHRKVHLLCSGKMVRIATSTMTITALLCKSFFPDEKFAIGQMFPKMWTPLQFALLT